MEIMIKKRHFILFFCFSFFVVCSIANVSGQGSKCYSCVTFTMQWFCLYDQHVANAHQIKMNIIHQHPLPAGYGVFKLVAIIKPNVKLPHAFSGEDALKNREYKFAMVCI